MSEEAEAANGSANGSDNASSEEDGIPPTPRTGRSLEDIREVLTTDVRIGIIGITIWTAMLVATVVLGVYYVFYFLFILGYLLAAGQLKLLAGRFPCLARITQWPGWARFGLVFAVALALRWLLLLQDQVITLDLNTYVGRAENMLDGRLPYLDFSGGTKPPAYQYMLYLMGVSVGPDALTFRALFSVADALTAAGVYALSRARYGVGHSLAMGMVYALCPVALVTIGLSGHYEGVVAIFAIGALLALWKGHRDWSAILLGISFALKIYPAAMLPFFAIAAMRMAQGNGDRKDRARWLPAVRYGCLFAIPALLSLVPLAVLDKGAVAAYFAERGVFVGWGSFTTFVREASGVTEVAGVDFAWIPIVAMGVLLFLFFYQWLRQGPQALQRWTRITIAVLVVHYGFTIALYFPYYRPAHWELMTVCFLAAWLSAAALFLPRALRSLDLGDETDLSTSGTGLAVASVLAITLFMMALPTLATWYFLWPLPFVLVISDRDTRLIFLWLLFWHAVGKGVSLLPGLPPIN